MKSLSIKKELRESSVESEIGIDSVSVVSSTPKKSVRQSRSFNDSPILHSSSNSLSRSNSLGKRKYHKDYDPDIELRQVSERSKKRISNSWADQSILHDEQDEDLQKYTGKCKKLNKIVKLEEDTEVLARRQSEIDKGKIKQCYKNYVYEIGKSDRKIYMPKTPNKFIKMSRRGWDGLIRKWKKHIHAWKEPNFEDLYATGVKFDCCGETSLRTSLETSDDNWEHSDHIPRVKKEKRELEEGTPPRPISRKRAVAPTKLERVDYDDDAPQEHPNYRDYDEEPVRPLKVPFTSFRSSSRDLHSGLTNDTDALHMSPVKRARLSESGL